MDDQLNAEELAAFVLLNTAIILVVERLMGTVFRRMRQPAVIGEIIAGIALGPTLQGGIPLSESRMLGTTLFPAAVRPAPLLDTRLGMDNWLSAAQALRAQETMPWTLCPRLRASPAAERAGQAIPRIQPDRPCARQEPPL